MSTTGFDHLYVETHDWAKAVAFWQRLGFELQYDTGHNSGMLRHPTGGATQRIRRNRTRTAWRSCEWTEERKSAAGRPAAL